MKKAVFVLMLMASTSVFAGDYEDGFEAYLRNDSATAFSKFKKAADAEDARAQYMVGSMYLSGDGVPRDYTQAVYWLTKAAEQGHAEAASSLGGLAGQRGDHEQRVYWHTEAAERGHVGSQIELVWIYHSGMVVPRDLVQAYKWAVISAVAQGREPPQRQLEGYEKEMTPEQIEEAKRRAREWKPKKE